MDSTITLVCCECHKEGYDVDITEAHEYSPYFCDSCAMEGAEI